MLNVLVKLDCVFLRDNITWWYGNPHAWKLNFNSLPFRVVINSIWVQTNAAK